MNRRELFRNVGLAAGVVALPMGLANAGEEGQMTTAVFYAKDGTSCPIIRHNRPINGMTFGSQMPRGMHVGTDSTVDHKGCKLDKVTFVKVYPTHAQNGSITNLSDFFVDNRTDHQKSIAKVFPEFNRGTTT